MTHICVGKLIIIGSDNGLSPGRRQAIIWINAGILLIGPLGTNFGAILITIQTFSFRRMHLKMSSAKWRLFFLGLNALKKKPAARTPRTTRLYRLGSLKTRIVSGFPDMVFTNHVYFTRCEAATWRINDDPVDCLMQMCATRDQVPLTWWRHQMETFSALLALCAGNSPVHGEFPAQRPVTRSFDVFFDRRLEKRLSKQSWGWWFETPSRSLWRHCNELWALRPVTYDVLLNCNSEINITP